MGLIAAGSLGFLLLLVPHVDDRGVQLAGFIFDVGAADFFAHGNVRQCGRMAVLGDLRVRRHIDDQGADRHGSGRSVNGSHLAMERQAVLFWLGGGGFAGRRLGGIILGVNRRRSGDQRGANDGVECDQLFYAMWFDRFVDLIACEASRQTVRPESLKNVQ